MRTEYGTYSSVWDDGSIIITSNVSIDMDEMRITRWYPGRTCEIDGVVVDEDMIDSIEESLNVLDEEYVIIGDTKYTASDCYGSGEIIYEV